MSFEPVKKMKLGLTPSKKKFKCAKLADHITKSLPAPLPELDLYSKVSDFPMYGNDQYGDCAFAGYAHLVGAWTAKAALKTALFTTDDVVAAYLDCTGGQDSGVGLEQLEQYAKDKGIKGHKTIGFCEIDLNDSTLVRQAATIFGGLGIGLLLAEYWTPDQTTWDANSGRPGYFQGSQGDAGHWVPIVGYKVIESRIYYAIVTWGKVIWLTHDALVQYGMGVYARISKDWIDQNTNTTPFGIDVPSLLADMDALNGPAPAPDWGGEIPQPIGPKPKPDPKPAPEPQGVVTYTMTTSNGVLTFTPTADAKAKFRFGSWLSDGVDVISKVVQEAATLADKYGPDAFNVLHAAANLAVHRDIESALALKDAVSELVADLNKPSTDTVKVSINPANFQNWLELAGIISQLIMHFA